jgi:uncharacterized protein YacL
MHSSYCLLSFALIGASIFTMLGCKSCDPFIAYEESLDENQKEIYANILREREKIYLYGLILGILLSSLYLYFSNKSYVKYNVCIFTSIILVTQYLFYMLYPKTHYMLEFMKNQDQVNKWLEVYKTMQNRYYLGGLFGIAGFLILGYYLNFKFSPKSKMVNVPTITYSVVVI